MRAIIPAAGIGTRLRPHTLTAPKVMIDVAGKPILAHIVDRLIEAGITECEIIVGYQKEVIINYFSSHYSIPIHFPVQEKMLGLGHAVSYGLEDRDEPALIILGDTIIESDFRQFIDSDLNLLGVVEVPDPQRFGIVETDDSMIITAMVEKPEYPSGNLAIAGIYRIRSQRQLLQAIHTLIEKNIRTRNEYQLTDALVLMMERGESFTAHKIMNWYDCGKKETLISTNQYLLGTANTIDGEIINSVLIPPVFVGKNACVTNSVIGPNVTVAAGAVLENCRIEHSIINDGCIVNNLVAAQTIIGSNSQVNGSIKSLNISDFSHIDLG